MIENKNKVIVCDLDGTLAESKNNLTEEMAGVICNVLEKNKFAVISGAGFSQFKTQFLSHLKCDENKNNLYIFPTNGSSCYVYDKEISDWKKLYENNLTESEKNKIIDTLKKGMSVSGFDFSGVYGEIIEDRGGQITFSGLGQEAPLYEKEKWDADRTKRRKIVDSIKNDIPEFEIRIGGATSIDITPKGIDKAYAIGKIIDVLECDKEDIVFIGDALFEGGNDESVKKTGVLTIAVSGPTETIDVLRKYL